MTDLEKESFRKAFRATISVILESYIESSKRLKQSLEDILNIEERKTNEIYKNTVILKELAEEILEKRISSKLGRF